MGQTSNMAVEMVDIVKEICFPFVQNLCFTPGAVIASSCIHERMLRMSGDGLIPPDLKYLTPLRH